VASEATESPQVFLNSKVFMVMEVLERTALANGQTLLILSIELDSWWTNLPYSVRQCATLYYDDHRTSEQFHSKLKSNMGMKLLSSRNRKTNALVLGLATMVFNCLHFIRQTALQSIKSPADAKFCPLHYRHRTGTA